VRGLLHHAIRSWPVTAFSAMYRNTEALLTGMPCIVANAVRPHRTCPKDGGKTRPSHPRNILKVRFVFRKMAFHPWNFLLLICFGISSISAEASEVHADNPLDYIAISQGTCIKLLFAGHDGTAKCKGLLLNEVFRDGRSGFTFTVGDLAVISFSGFGSKQVKDSPDKVTQPIDTVIFTLIGVGTPPNRIMAVGTCTFSNPNVGPMLVRCSSHTENGLFEATFRSDGHAPSIQH
jgi:hypothetical protein